METSMRAIKPETVADPTEEWRWEWVEFVKTECGWVPASCFESIPDSATTKWSRGYAKEAVRKLKQSTPLIEIRRPM
jgi:hypothetical protein